MAINDSTTTRRGLPVLPISSWQCAYGGRFWKGTPRMTDTTPKQHPAWDRYHRSENLWRALVEQAGAAHRLMQDAADELERDGEMSRDYR